MINIDGSERSGSGTIVRYAVALCSLLGEESHITNIRAKRDKPGLRPQHLASVRACAQMCDAHVEGAEVNSKEIAYKPGEKIKGGYYEWDIGTAGSTTMLVMSLLPLACFADKDTTIKVTGGLFQDFAPSAHHMQHVLFPTLAKMGVQAALEVIRPGYVPRGGGVIQVKIKSVDSIRPLVLSRQGKVKSIKGLSLSSHLEKGRVSERMARECRESLVQKGYRPDIETLWDETSSQEGASLAIWAETDTGCLLGADRAGRRGRSSEEIGRYVARTLLEDLEAGATVDRYLADQLIIYAALARGTTQCIIPRLTGHVETNLWLVEQFGARPRLEGNDLQIKGLELTRQG
ncbi:MAG: RNA 3'-phosphate cyclase [Chloroflexi bacterium CG07_land_8_20_14_0_80_51_10]|nr:MAG: RNA 3'-phosphate cyclase [Chloroflexi bacterium CG07_land_8_20_14_0_80_51_10]